MLLTPFVLLVLLGYPGAPLHELEPDPNEKEHGTPTHDEIGQGFQSPSSREVRASAAALTPAAPSPALTSPYVPTDPATAAPRQVVLSTRPCHTRAMAAADVRGSTRLDTWGAWTEVLASCPEDAEGYTVTVWSRARRTILVEWATGPSGREVSRTKPTEVQPRTSMQSPQVALQVYEPLPLGTRFSARIKSEDPDAVARIRVTPWTRPPSN